MKIAYDNQIFNMQRYGGISRYYTELASQLYDKSIDTKVFAGLHRNEYIQKYKASFVLGKQVTYLPKTANILLKANNVLADSYFSIKRPDIVHRTYYNNKNKIKKSINVITVYDMIHELFPDDFSAKDNTAYLKSITIKQADHIICISESTKNDLLRIYDIPESNISVTYLGYHSLPDVKSTYIDNQTFTNSEKPFLLFVGHRGGYKNFLRFLKAFSISKKLVKDFDIIAFGGGKFSIDEKRYISELGLEEKQVKNIQGGDDILSVLYSKAMLFVYPSLYEGFGLPPLEAMDHSCPVVCSNTSSIPEVVGKAALMFSPSDVDDMSHTMEKVLYNSSIRDDLILAGLERTNSFSWQKCAADTLAVYRSIL
ncbi:glycosyltransferase family 4 protein [Psychrobacter maritimus]|uniref:glycosyltransferase family 4 protein n=1 Tax=Psychrobacter maritimus TaxID=256325 RepID=UPI001917C037|nr:glycosyltransferase family 1 protein [Psychrobacter maritimus]